jgi:hypothetical protein
MRLYWPIRIGSINLPLQLSTVESGFSYTNFGHSSLFDDSLGKSPPILQFSLRPIVLLIEVLFPPSLLFDFHPFYQDDCLARYDFLVTRMSGRIQDALCSSLIAVFRSRSLAERGNVAIAEVLEALANARTYTECQVGYCQSQVFAFAHISNRTHSSLSQASDQRRRSFCSNSNCFVYRVWCKFTLPV